MLFTIDFDIPDETARDLLISLIHSHPHWTEEMRLVWNTIVNHVPSYVVEEAHEFASLELPTNIVEQLKGD